MKSMRIVLLAFSLSLLFSGVALTQGMTDKGDMMEKGDMGKGPMHGGMKAILDKNGKITKDEYLDLAKQRAEMAWKKLDPEGKGVVTKEEMDSKRQERKEKRMLKKQAAPQ
ncbi:MAG: hypothetical protein HQK81_02780 [Desulfovibrionaceae bacterium]|nr:hypothetical protein [Desulfovibrionaceae bacterium]MBF0512970.1 hypothetical protein [Desulfovibrionaceae bacterium]